jgi:hypothetical protein
MATWSWSIGPWKPGASTKTSLGGGPVADIGSASARSLKLRLLDPSDATFTVLGTSDEAQLLEELITDVWVYRDGVSLFRGRVTKTTDTLNASGLHTVAVEAHDYRSVLDRRIAYTDRTWTSAGQAQTVWDALTDTQLLAGGSLGLTQGVWPGTDVVRPSVIIKAGDTVYSFIKKLGQMQGGFDFDIDDSLRANLWSPYEVDVEVDASDVEKVTVVAGDIRLDPKSVLRGIAKRVQQLSKR